MPERFQATATLEPIRRVTLIAPADGFIRSIESRLGASVKELQELVQLDRYEAAAWLKMAAAEVAEKQAIAKNGTVSSEVIRAQLDAARAKVELAQMALDRCTLRAPFSGRLVSLPMCAGQYVTRGTVLAELADLSSLKALVPVDRHETAMGASLVVQIEGQDVEGKVQAIMPLPERFVALRELATPFAAAWVVVPNTKKDLEPGLRVRSTTVPVTPIATVARRAIKRDAASAESASVQVIRNEYVTNVPVRILGDSGPERTQITGLFRRADKLIVSTSVPLLAGTLVRFGDGAAATNRGIEGMPPDPRIGGSEAMIADPASARSRPASAGRPARSAARGSAGQFASSQLTQLDHRANRAQSAIVPTRCARWLCAPWCSRLRHDLASALNGRNDVRAVSCAVEQNSARNACPSVCAGSPPNRDDSDEYRIRSREWISERPGAGFRARPPSASDGVRRASFIATSR